MLIKMQVPSVNDVPLQNLVSGSLVHYRCMVQDLFDPEFFLSTYEVHDINDPTKRRICCSLHRDVVNCEVRFCLRMLKFENLKVTLYNQSINPSLFQA